MREEKTFGLVTLPLAAGQDSITAKSGTVPALDGVEPLVLALIDPKPMTRQSILEALARAFPDYCTMAASCCEDLIAMQARPLGGAHLVIIHTRNAQLTDPWVVNAIELVRLHLTGASIVLLSDRDDVGDVAKALSYGVRGYIPTSIEAEVAFAALRLIHAGGTFVPADALSSAGAKPDTGSDCMHPGLRDDVNLTPRELSVVALLREGKPNKVIASELHMQESTVKVHVRNIFKKLRVGNRTHAAFVANRLLDPSSPWLRSNGGAGFDRHADADAD